MVSLRPAKSNSPSVILTTKGSSTSVLKSYSHCSLWLRETVGRLAISRECWALSKLRDSNHTPNLLDRPKAWAMETEFIEGTPLESLTKDDVDSQRLLEQGQSLLHDLKKVGVVHGDLGHDHWQSMGRECNLIWTLDQRLVAIDFASSVPTRTKWPLANGICQALAKHDELLNTKLAYHFGPEELKPKDCVSTQWPVGLWDLLRILGKI